MRTDFGELLRTLRTRRGLTQRHLADLSTISVRAIRDLESGRACRPRPDTVRLIADGLRLRGACRSEFEQTSRADHETEPLPAPLGLMLGRDTEQAQLCALLSSGAQRLVTLTGLAGTGKSRLAMAVAATLRDVDGMAAVWRTRADLGTTRAALDGRPAVLVLDGVAGRAPRDEVVALLHHRGELRVLCTARSPLDVPGEWVVPLGPLAVPATDTGADPDVLGGVPAVALLLHHVAKTRPGFRLTEGNSAAVAAIVRGLAGVPALLEAAAGWLLVYEPAELVAHLHSEPSAFATGRFAQWRDAVRDVLAAQDTTGRAVLSALAGSAELRSVTELAAATALPPHACASALRRLALLGLVTIARGATGRFQLLEPVRTVCPEPVRAAAVLPRRLPVPALPAP
jgi:transcriptional regulator with XRE-family HTH domain